MSKIIAFHGLTDSGDDNRIFSNFAPSRIEYEDHIFLSSEQLFMYLKAMFFKDDEQAEAILDFTKDHESDFLVARKDLIMGLKNSPGLKNWMKLMTQVKGMGRKVRNFDKKRWDDESICAMITANYEKYTQDDVANDTLLSTEDRILAEAAPRDLIWGTGVGFVQTRNGNWRGKNTLGYILMELRNYLIN